jgi:hypothetical protein
MPISSKVTTLTGGLNEQVSNLELKPGELIVVKNYLEQDSEYHGYESFKGYERFDGTTAPSSVALDDATFGAEDDTSREAARTAIDAVAGTGDILGVHIYSDKVYAFRNTAMYVSDSTVGWGNGTLADTAITGTDINSGSTAMRFINARFAEYNTNNEVMLWVDGVSQPHVYNGTTVSQIDMTSVVGAGVFPTHVGAWQNRLFLVYPDGHILFSEVGDPTAWNSATGLAGEIYIGGDVTNVIEAPGGTLVFFTRTTTHILQYGSTSNEFIFKLDEFSDRTGALPDTTKNMLGTVYYTDDRGFSSLEQTAEFGDFSGANIGRNVRKTFALNRANMKQSVLDRDKSRFFQFYTDSIRSKTNALAFTFRTNFQGQKVVKGATIVALDHIVSSVAEGEINNVNRIFIGCTNGLVYEFQSGTSFDGETIEAALQTSYNHFGSPRNWKRFKRLQFEITAPTTVTYNVKQRYNYGSADILGGNTKTPEVQGKGGVWGEGVWGTFIWGGAILSIVSLYNHGYGINMSTEVKTEDKYAEQHVIHNFITDYSQGGLQN